MSECHQIVDGRAIDPLPDLIEGLVVDVDDGMTPFDAFRAATAETRGWDVRTSEEDDEDIEVSRTPLDPPEEC